jgi:hypothetical protein
MVVGAAAYIASVRGRQVWDMGEGQRGQELQLQGTEKLG